MVTTQIAAVTVLSVVACSFDSAHAEVVYDALNPYSIYYWHLTDAGETSSFEELPDGGETNGMVADYMHLAGTARYGTLLEFGTNSFNRTELGQADVIIRLHAISDGLPGDAFWSATLEDVVFEYGSRDKVESVALNTWLPDECFVSFELVNVYEPGLGVFFGLRRPAPNVGQGDPFIYYVDSQTMEWEIDNYYGYNHLSVRIHAVPTPGAAAAMGLLLTVRSARGRRR